MGKAKQLAARLAEYEARLKLVEDALNACLDAGDEAECAETWDVAPSVPRPATVGDDYRFFLRYSGLVDRPELWRAFLAGRLTG